MKIFYLFLLINLSIFAQDHEHHAGCQHRHYPEELNDSDLEVIPFVDTLFASCQERQNLKSKNDISLQTLLFVDNLFESHGDRIGEALGEIEGFGHAHEDDHGHSGPEDGFQWRHAEIEFAASYKNLITLGSVFGFSEGEKEVEELFLQTDALPFGFGLKLGRFRSGIGRFTQRHQHALDFTSQNLTQLTFFGDHGIQENGIQLIWNTPSIEGLLLGVELFEGDTEGFSEGMAHAKPWRSTSLGRGMTQARSGPWLIQCGVQ